MTPPIDYLFLWLEMNGLHRVRRCLRNVAMSYMMFISGGLALAATLNGLALVVNLVLIPTVSR